MPLACHLLAIDLAMPGDQHELEDAYPVG